MCLQGPDGAIKPDVHRQLALTLKPVVDVVHTKGKAMHNREKANRHAAFVAA